MKKKYIPSRETFENKNNSFIDVSLRMNGEEKKFDYVPFYIHIIQNPKKNGPLIGS